MKILALDQATKTTGYSVWNDDTLLKHGVIEVGNNKFDTITRMIELQKKIEEILISEEINSVAIEGVQYQQNQKVYSTLSQLQGVLFSLFFFQKKPFFIIEPSSWKSFAQIKSRKRKEQKLEAIKIVKERYMEDVTEDEADAILLGSYAVTFIKEER